MNRMKRKTAAIIGRVGGTSRSDSKLAAARANGRLGGRPRSRAKRCPCGAMTAACAAVRCHYCEPPDPGAGPELALAGKIDFR
jgi:hypothetical protein